MARFGRGERITTSVDRISNAGNGLITEYQGESIQGHINIGPVQEDSVDTQVTLRIINYRFAWCETESVKSPDYESICEELVEKHWIDSLKTPPPGGFEQNLPNFCPNCNVVVKKLNDRWVCPHCDYTHLPDSSDSTQIVVETGQETVTETSTDRESGVNQTQEQRSQFRNQDETVELEELRNKAEESSTEEPKGIVSSSTTKEQYHRSSAIRDYVMARADGVCEGCGEQAPFKSKTGEPYLHAHHIHELSDGGSDTPDTVVALCPNCHYKVHHGENGDEYNQELLMTVQNKEAELN